ncbi:endonuclease/exonuclease/phosphatase family protein [Paenarthrobacter nitroguajacolicus]|uniref:Endonuclease/exonuclease/phosphatase family protein n=1 Tax=Paenarthrobacter nitroguajacolicus TaxID=211146 RepID=A0A558H6C8_PAENT|nr:endonuclease/exonuclease/phosphatase family protein [Paenarthrobacter nitroguajacolicus]TVU64673.1 endonuclease/exonuclease/phosphatase family protein [Paenarthrobacter nitroguajacolicus]
MEKDTGTTYATARQRGLLEARRRRPRARDWVVCLFAGLLMALLFGHGLVPEVRGMALAIESFLPWVGAVIAALLIVALLSKAWFGALPAAAALVSWCVIFLPVVATGIASASAAGASEEAVSGWSVVTQNLRAGNPDADVAVAKLIKSGADVVVLQELSGPTLERISPLMDGTFAHRQVAGTVGVWSRFPLSQGRPLALGLGWSRALSMQLESPDGPVQLYAVHLPSVRPSDVTSRNSGLAKLSRMVEADPSPRILVVGDFNAANTDRAFSPLLAILDDARSGFGFTWPASLPATRPDHILFRGFTVSGASVISSPGTDHLATMAWLQPGPTRPTVSFQG